MSEGERPRKQHYVFAHYALREFAFDYPDQVIDILRGPQSVGFLGKLWENCRKFAVEKGDTTQIDEVPSSTPCDFGALVGAIVKMPLPYKLTEAYYIALVSSRSTAMAHLPSLNEGMREYYRQKGNPDLRYYTLEWTDAYHSHPSAVLCAWGADGEHANFEQFVQPKEKEFIEAVGQLVAESIGRLGKASD